MNDLAELVFILDRSGSMSGLEADTIGGFNAMIDKQRGEKGCALVSAVLFDGESDVLYDRINICGIRPMTAKDYCVRGSTALYDAIGGAVHHIANIHKYARKEDVPAHTMFVITTDGMENSSVRYTREEIKRTIKKMKNRYGWEFIFLGANIDAAETAESIGIAPEMSANYHSDPAGTRLNYDVIGEAISSVRCSKRLNVDWKKRINDDFAKRGGQK